MKLSKIYSNKKDIFEPISFRPKLNVIYAVVKAREDKGKDSHNLGKTLLISLIDFMMLRRWSAGLFLHDHTDVFREFVFFLEIELNSGEFLTIRRGVLNNSKISFKLHAERDQDFTTLNDVNWDEVNLPLEKAKDFLNEKLNLTIMGEWQYRKGITYFLRDQKDWSDVFQIAKFIRDDHKNWKPYLARILGFDDALIMTKYALDESVAELEDLKNKQTRLLQVDPQEYDKIRGYIEIKQQEIDDLTKRIEQFDFFKEEISVNTELVKELEERVTDINETLYAIKYEVERITESLEKKENFDIESVRKLFDEMGIYFPDNLDKDFVNLMGFNRKITSDREARLKERMDALVKKEKELTAELKNLNENREKKLAFLREHDTFKKYRERQNRILSLGHDLNGLNQQLKNLDTVHAYDAQIQAVVKKRDGVVQKIDKLIKQGNETIKAIRISYNDIVRAVLNASALLSIKLNSQGNLEFNADIISSSNPDVITSEGEGTTYKKMLCAAFDLAVLSVHSEGEFFRFVYHDGILEGSDDRKKINLLDTVRAICEEKSIQYILTLIDDDLPRDENDKKIEFEDEVIIKRLHDKDDSGRLFKMPAF